MTTACTAFEGLSLIASGDLLEVTRAAKAVVDRGPALPVLIFDDEACRHIEVDFRGSVEEVLARLETSPPPGPAPAEAHRGPGRPKLGVVAREVTLLPRHWDWLGQQPGGASVALRKLVEAARRDPDGSERVRRAQEAAHRFMTVMAGNQPGFEEAARALFAGKRERFEEMTAGWPGDVRNHARKLAAGAFA